MGIFPTTYIIRIRVVSKKILWKLLINTLQLIIMHKAKLLSVFSILLLINTMHAQDRITLDSIISLYEKPNLPKSKSPWPDCSDAYYEAKLAHYKVIQTKLSLIDGKQKNLQDSITYNLLKFVVDDEVYTLTWQDYLIPLNAEGGFLTDIVYTLNGYMVRDTKDISNYTNRLKMLPNYLFEVKDLLTKGVKERKVSPKLIVDNCLKILALQIPENIEESLYYKPIKNLNSKDREEFSKLIKTVVYPSLKNFQNYLENEYRPAANESLGISDVRDGVNYYDQRIRYYTTLNMTPEEVFQTGLKEVDRIKYEMDSIITALKFKGSFADFIKFLRTDKQFYANSPQLLLQRAAWISKEIEGKLPKYFGKLPRNPFTVKPVPAELAPTYTTGRYSSGSYERRKAGEYWVNTYNLPTRPLYVMPALTLHEAVPGHHLQGSLTQELTGLPRFRNSTYLSAYGEGWALYTEYLGKEMGMYETSYEDFGRLTYEMWRACRLVVDVGLHSKKWSREKAIDFLANNTALSMHEVNTEIDRYIGWPGQAVSYKIGEIKIRLLRKQAEERMKERFNLSDFHDKILENGTVTLSMLETILNNTFK